MTEFCGDDSELLLSVTMRKYFGELKIHTSAVKKKSHRFSKSVSYFVSWLVNELPRS